MLRWHVVWENMMKCICYKIFLRPIVLNLCERRWFGDDLVLRTLCWVQEFVHPMVSSWHEYIWVQEFVHPTASSWHEYIWVMRFFSGCSFSSWHNVAFTFVSPVQSPNKLFITRWICNAHEAMSSPIFFKIIYIQTSRTYIYLHFSPWQSTYIIYTYTT